MPPCPRPPFPLCPFLPQVLYVCWDRVGDLDDTVSALAMDTFARILDALPPPDAGAPTGAAAAALGGRRAQALQGGGPPYDYGSVVEYLRERKKTDVYVGMRWGVSAGGAAGHFGRDRGTAGTPGGRAHRAAQRRGRLGHIAGENPRLTHHFTRTVPLFFLKARRILRRVFPANPGAVEGGPGGHGGRCSGSGGGARGGSGGAQATAGAATSAAPRTRDGGGRQPRERWGPARPARDRTFGGPGACQGTAIPRPSTAQGDAGRSEAAGPPGRTAPPTGTAGPGGTRQGLPGTDLAPA